MFSTGPPAALAGPSPEALDARPLVPVLRVAVGDQRVPVGDAEDIAVVARVVVAQALAQLDDGGHTSRVTSASTTACRSSGVMPTEHGSDRPRV